MSFDIEYLKQFQGITSQVNTQVIPKVVKRKVNDIMVRRKKVTRNSITKFAIGLDNKIQVLHEGIYYDIYNYQEIILECMLYPTPFTGGEPKRFKYEGDNLEKRIQLLRKHWSRYDFRYEPIILQIDKEHRVVIIETKEDK